MRIVYTKTIVLEFLNVFTKEIEIKVQMPYSPYKATMGYYSKTYKRFYKLASEGMNNIKGSHKLYNQKTTQIYIVFGSGIKMQLPPDFNKKDLEILNLHVEAYKLAFTK